MSKHCSICNYPVEGTLYVTAPSGRIYCFDCLCAVSRLMELERGLGDEGVRTGYDLNAKLREWED